METKGRALALIKQDEFLDEIFTRMQERRELALRKIEFMQKAIKVEKDQIDELEKTQWREIETYLKEKNILGDYDKDKFGLSCDLNAGVVSLIDCKSAGLEMMIRNLLK